MALLYLAHFAQPVGNSDPANPYSRAQHYCGYTTRTLDARFQEHIAGAGSHLLNAVFRQYRVPVVIARLWHGAYEEELLLKATKHFSRYCPMCCAEAGRQVSNVPFEEVFDFEQPPSLVAYNAALPDAATRFLASPVPDDNDFPAPPRGKVGWDATEIAYLRRWQAARNAPPYRVAGLDAVDVPLPW